MFSLTLHAGRGLDNFNLWLCVLCSSAGWLVLLLHINHSIFRLSLDPTRTSMRPTFMAEASGKEAAGYGKTYGGGDEISVVAGRRGKS